MATANLNETLMSITYRKAQIQLEISNYQSQKALAVASQADARHLYSAEKTEIKEYYKNLFKESPELAELYKDYTEIPDFEEELNRIDAKMQEELEELAYWESTIDNQITTLSAELEELKAYEESYKSMLSSNIQEDYNYGLNG